MQLEYKEQLADARWLKKRNEILERDNYTCQKCGATSHLNVHHLSYEKNRLAWEYPNERLITLCEGCHENEHRIVVYPQVGRFYRFDHSDYTNDMICYHIDSSNRLVYMFGVDDGAYGSAYIYIFNFDEFYYKCRNSDIFKGEDWCEYTERSFCLAIEELKNEKAYIIGRSIYSERDTISYARRKLNSLLNRDEDLNRKINHINEIEMYE